MSRSFTRAEIDQIIKPIERPIHSFHQSFDGIERFLENLTRDCPAGYELVPDFQRGHVWTDQQRTHFIENVLRRIVSDDGLMIRLNCPSWRWDPKPDSDLPDQAVCIDGLQRLTAIRAFMSGEVNPFGLTKDQICSGWGMRRIDRMVVFQIYDFQYRRDLLQFYLDINGGGTPHTPAELERVQQLLKESAA
ncbi:MAG: DUF262 domain-containing protein [Pseudomonadota bacterium]|nr:DUF262 domain-containing protein [Pseudomonadota bacterium]